VTAFSTYLIGLRMLAFSSWLLAFSLIGVGSWVLGPRKTWRNFAFASPEILAHKTQQLVALPGN
jgi:hypothetical protein